MNTKIAIPVEDEKGLDAKVAEHFGRAPYYAIIEFDKSNKVSNVKTVPNSGEHFGGVGEAHGQLLKLKPNAIIAYGMGPRGLMSFQGAGITVLKANAGKVSELVSAYKGDKLQVLTDGCEHAHHR
jgi:predicted Fe-Mo cluster-binding NifX family protein